jgi:hypothetical protein
MSTPESILCSVALTIPVAGILFLLFLGYMPESPETFRPFARFLAVSLVFGVCAGGAIVLGKLLIKGF